jgi:hypothetical protein
MPPQAPQAPQQGGGFGQLVSQIFDGLGTLQEVISKAKPEAVERFAALQQQFQQAIESLNGEDEGQEMSPKPEGAASPEAGASDAMPM